MVSKFGYKLTQTANADLDDIVSYLAVELANPKAATDFMDKLQSAIGEARVFPESGPEVISEVLRITNVRKKLVGSYILYYLPDFTQKTIFVLRIVYGRRNMDEILKELDTR